MRQGLPDCEKVKKIAADAGAAILEELSKLDTLNVQHKDDASPVTHADKRTHDIVCEGLKALTPDIPIMSEEDTANHASLIGAKEYWCVDPLDGTRTAIAYANGSITHTGFGVHVGLIRDGVPLFGAVYFPARGVMYYTGNDGKAYRQLDGGAPELLKMRPQPLSRPMDVAVGYRGVVPTEIAGKESNPIRSVGGGRILEVAEGKTDAAYMADHDAFSFWDVAAAHAILRGAGGEMVALPSDRAQHGNADMLKGSALARYHSGLGGKPIPAIGPSLAASGDTLRLLGAPATVFPQKGRGVS